MITDVVKFLAKEIEAIARLKIKLAEIEQSRQFSQDEKDDIYCQAILDELGKLFQKIPLFNRQEIYMALQIEEMESEDNEYFAGTVLKHPPNDHEKKEHYLNSKRPVIFAKWFKFILNSGSTG